MQEQLILKKTKQDKIEELEEGLKLAKKLKATGQIIAHERELAYEKAKKEFEELGFKVLTWKSRVEIDGEKYYLSHENIKYYRQEAIPLNVLKAIEEHGSLFDRIEVWYPYRGYRDPLLVGVKALSGRRGYNDIYVLLGVWE